MKPLVFIMGPTAAGKTNWAIQWAEISGAGILNSDSIQAYKELNIGSAKPDFSKYPHIERWLFDEISAPRVWTAGDFRKKAMEILKKRLPSKKILVAGGSYFYIQALEKGMYPAKPVPTKIAKKWESLLKQKGLERLYQELQKTDPLSAKQISPKDQYRIVHALSLRESEGKPLSQIKKEFKAKKLPWPYLKLALRLSREELSKRLERRIRYMLKSGLLEETESLVARGFRQWRPLNSVGYKEALMHLEGKITKEDLPSAILKSSMALAKKQNTWLKKDKSIKWLDAQQPALKVYKEIFK